MLFISSESQLYSLHPLRSHVMLSSSRKSGWGQCIITVPCFAERKD